MRYNKAVRNKGKQRSKHKLEKYGTVPKRFTKAWWEYFWDYYKWHTLGTAFALVLIAITAVQCATRIDYDLTLTAAGNMVLSNEQSQLITDKLSEYISDADKNGENHVFLQQLTMSSGETVDPQYEMAMSTKLTLEVAAGEGYLFLFTKEQADNYLNSGECEGMFMQVSEWADEMPADNLLSLSGGKPYAVKLSESKFLSDLGIDMSDCYLMMRLQRNDEKEEDVANTKYQNSLIAANLLIVK